MSRATDPALSFHFMLDIGGKVQGYFTEVGGIGSEHELIEHKVVDASGRDIIQSLPGRLKWTPITLKRGITKEMDVWQWRKQVEDGDVDGARTSGSIIMLDQQGNPVARWDFERGWPSKVTGPQIQADSNAFGIEEMTIVHEGIERVSV